jgi:glycine/D-amino acid oxidase-like deaminating enzyme
LTPAPDPFPSDTGLPAKTNVVIIGGGIIGTSTALELTERGIDVVLCEKGIIAGEQSSRNWGWCRQMGRDPREIPLIKLSLELWRNLNQRTGHETGYEQCGIVYLCDNEKDLAAREHWLDAYARPNGLSSHMISPREAGERAPGGTRPWKGGLYTPDDGRAEPQKAAVAIAKAARKAGAKIFTNCAVRGYETAGGRISAVITENGRIDCDTVVLAGGAWSRRFCTNAGIELPQLTVVNSVMRTKPIETPISHSIAGNNFSLRKRFDGGYTISHATASNADIVPDSFRLFRAYLPALRAEVRNLKLRLGSAFLREASLARHWQLDQHSPFEKIRILDPAPNPRLLKQTTTSLIDRYPIFDTMEIAERWAGAIDVTPDAVPVISAIDQVPGLYMATGFSGHGFGIGPGAGRLAADLVLGKTPCVDPDPFRYQRLVDGSRIELFH